MTNTPQYAVTAICAPPANALHMSILALVGQLLNHPAQDIELALLTLMTQGKLNFLSLQHAYVRYLENLKDINQAQLIEADTCVLESLMYDKIPKSEQAERSVQRRLYLLNQNKRFKMDSLNKELGYDEERAKTYNHTKELTGQ